MSPLALAYALGGAVSWSLANLTIGPAARRVGTWTSLVVVTAVGVGLMTVAAALFEPVPTGFDGRDAWLMAGAVGSSVLALGGLFVGFEQGKVSVVAPIVAAWSVLSTGIGLLSGETLTAVGFGGVGLVVVGNAVLGASEKGEGEEGRGSGVVPAAISALGFGLMAPCVDALGDAHGRLWTPPAVWFGTLLVGVPLLVRTRRLRPFATTASNLRVLAAPSVFEAGGFVCMSLALGHGALSSVTPVSSLSTGITVLLGLAVLRERLRPIALAGAVAASVGVVLIQL